jgi:hypothetical protein
MLEVFRGGFVQELYECVLLADVMSSVILGIDEKVSIYRCLFRSWKGGLPEAGEISIISAFTKFVV